MLFRLTVVPFRRLAILCFDLAHFCVRATVISIPSLLQTSVPPLPQSPSIPSFAAISMNKLCKHVHVYSRSTQLRCLDFCISVRFIESVALCMCLLFHTSLGWTFMEPALTVCKKGTPRTGTETATNNRLLCCLENN